MSPTPSTTSTVRAVEPSVDPAVDPSSDPSVEAVRAVAAERSSRRRAILGLAGVAAAGATAVVVGAEPAAAGGQGQGLTLGDPGNSATGGTGLTMNNPAQPTLTITQSSTGTALLAIREEASGLHQASGALVGDAFNAHGVVGLSSWQTAIVGRSVKGNGVVGETTQGIGVVGRTAWTVGVWGESSNPVSTGVYGKGGGDVTNDSAGVMGDNPTGPALVGRGKVQARLIPSGTAGAPRGSGVGSLHVDSLGVLRAAVASGTWRTVAGPATAGAFHVLPAPARVYDSRPGTQPAVGPKAKLVAGSARAIDVTANASGVPATASAVLLTVLLVNAPKASGNLTVWASGVARPQANSMVWGGDAGRFTATPTSAVAGGKVQVLASHATDIVIDVVGYYA